MPRGQKRDLQATAAAGFLDPESFVSLDGRLFLAGEDWKAQVQKVFVADKGICQLCYKPIDTDYQIWDADHVVRRSDGASDDLLNLRLVHRTCHIKRHAEKQTHWTSREAKP